ncbi:hypothetical protein OC846_005460 [Tilletia horrida]|uniref:Uncharacterized protein n=1 Tax=Tilletia horrida TaxID=155126 RepID=A0AAN6GNH2_9BASI|nr:hypothetical protein OC846_005460 [Tilletia horrida]KAK0566300.1 hypothetical protein OC861_003301 [Tilletia horrida]
MSGEEPIFPPSLGEPGSEVVYYPSPLTPRLAAAAAVPAAVENEQISFTVSVPPASLPHIFAHRQWRAGMILADLLASTSFSSPTAGGGGFMGRLIRDKTVLELGCGTALPALVAAHPQLGQAAFVLATDYNEDELILALKHNVARNADTTSRPTTTTTAAVAAGGAASGSSLKAAGYTWGTSPDDIFDLMPRSVLTQRMDDAQKAPRSAATALAASRFDTILLADTLWDLLSHSDLAKSLSQTLAQTAGARVIVVAGLHTGRERISEFVHKAARVGLCVCPLDDCDGSTTASASASSASASSFSGSKSLWTELELIREEELEGKLARRSRDDVEAEAWTEHVLEFELAREEHEDDDDDTAAAAADDGNDQQHGSRAQLASDDDAAYPLRIESRGPRLTGRRRRFVSRERWRPEEAKERGGIKLRNRWMTVWTLRWEERRLFP